MSFRFTEPWWLLLLLPAGMWIFWFAFHTDVHTAAWRRYTSLLLRVFVLAALVFALAGFQALWRVEGLNLFFVLDRSQSVPANQQEASLAAVNRLAALKRPMDKAGVIIFGTEASIESLPNPAVNLTKINAVVRTERTDLAGAIRLGTAALPETGQKRLVLLTDANENVGDALAATLAARNLGVSIDVFPLGVARPSDISVQKLQVPPRLKTGQSFEVKIFAEGADREAEATVRLWRNDQNLGEQKVRLQPGKNLFAFPQKLTQPGFYSYDVQVETPGDPVPQNNRASAFALVAGEPRVLIISSDPAQDATLQQALQSARLQTRMAALQEFPATLAELQSYDAIFLNNVSAGDLGRERQNLLESAVRDFGVGLVCVGGDQAYAAGGYRGTPLETVLPVSMELSSKKVLPSGAVVLIMHGMEFMGGDQIARDCAQGVLAALGPSDEMGVLLWDGSERWLFPLQKVGNKKELARQIDGMNQGDLGSFQHVLELADAALVKSKSNLKHIIVFSDGDPQAPKLDLLETIVGHRITVSTVLIAGHVGPETMIWMAENGRGRFHNVTSPADLPQVFIKETAVILKAAIYEEPFKPQLRITTEPVSGIRADQYPQLLGYVATTPKARAETPLWTDKGDPLLAHWQYGLGRAVAFTSDAKARWARNWIAWPQYQQFWSQVAQWSLRRLENTGFTTDVTLENGEGVINLDAADEQGNHLNFLNLRAAVVSPKGERTTVRLEQTAPGHYQAKFPALETGAYLLNIVELKNGKVAGSQVAGASVNYSPEYNATSPDARLMQRIAESSGGLVLDPNRLAPNPFLHDRRKTYQPQDVWPWLLRLAIVLFTIDVGLRRIQLDREELALAWARARRFIPFLKPRTPKESTQPTLASLLAKRDIVRAGHAGAPGPSTPDLFTPSREPSPEAPSPPSAKAPEPPHEMPAPASGSTASKLLEAKRRAQRKHQGADPDKSA